MAWIKIDNIRCGSQLCNTDDGIFLHNYAFEFYDWRGNIECRFTFTITNGKCNPIVFRIVHYKCIFNRNSFQAVVKKIHPFYLMIPCGIASSLTFLTQIGTPTNAYVATYGNIPSYDLLFSGLFPTLFSIVLFPFIFIFWGKFIFPVIFQDFNT